MSENNSSEAVNKKDVVKNLVLESCNRLSLKVSSNLIESLCLDESNVDERSKKDKRIRVLYDYSKNHNLKPINIFEKSVNGFNTNSFDTMHDIYDYYNGEKDLNDNMVLSYLEYLKQNKDDICDGKSYIPITELLPISLNEDITTVGSISSFMNSVILELSQDKRNENKKLITYLTDNQIIDGTKYNNLRIFSDTNNLNILSANTIQDKNQM